MRERPEFAERWPNTYLHWVGVAPVLSHCGCRLDLFRGFLAVGSLYSSWSCNYVLQDAIPEAYLCLGVLPQALSHSTWHGCTRDFVSDSITFRGTLRSSCTFQVPATATLLAFCVVASLAKHSVLSGGLFVCKTRSKFRSENIKRALFLRTSSLTPLPIIGADTWVL